MISSDRMAHQLSVARTLVKLAREENAYTEAELQDLFVLGFVHDIGYEFAENPDDHASVGGELLKRAGFKYWQEVSNHGKPDCSYASPELALLNAADMHTSPAGEYLTYADRLQDIADRYGEASLRYKNAARIIASLEA